MVSIRSWAAGGFVLFCILGGLGSTAARTAAVAPLPSSPPALTKGANAPAQGTPTPITTPIPTPACGPGWNIVTSPNQGASDNLFLAVAALAANDVWAVGQGNSGVTQALIAHWNGSQWRVVPHPNPGANGNQLHGIAALSPTNIWAVGDYVLNSSSGHQPLIEHWNGVQWSVVPAPGLLLEGRLLSVAARAADDIWAVGAVFGDPDPARTLILHWDGSVWSLIPSPNPGQGRNGLFGVTALAANDAWAVGYYSANGGSPDRTLIVHWNGTAWTPVASPNLGTAPSRLYAVAAVAPNDLWAVGEADATSTQMLIGHWNGTAWSLEPTSFTGGLHGIAVRTTTDVWAVGDAYETRIVHWDGAGWSVVPSPNVGIYGNHLYGGVALGATEVWAVGGSQGYGGTFSTLTEHYTAGGACLTPTATPTGGTATPLATRTPTATPTCGWQVVTAPDIGFGAALRDVAVVAANDVWAVGNSYAAGTWSTLLEHWDGTQWSRRPSPNPATTPFGLLGVAAAATDDVWAVGWYRDGSNVNQPLLEHWDGQAWSLVPGPVLPAGGALWAVTARTTTDVWAVGETNIPHAGLVLHWDGTAWGVVPNPTSANLIGVAALAADDAWAVGTAASNAVTLHWDGQVWSNVPHPASPASELHDVAGSAANDVWAVGRVFGGATLTLHWDGQAWSIVPSPGGASGNTLEAVAARAADDVWAVGYVESVSGSEPLALHWEGTSWSLMPPPNIRGSYKPQGVAMVTRDDVWAVGEAANSPALTHHVGRCVLMTPTPCPIQFTDIASTNPFYSYIRCLACRGIVGGYPCGGPGEPCPGAYFRPGNNVTRGQTSKMVAGAANFLDPVPSTQQTFADIAPTSTFWLWIEQLAGRGIVGGYPCGGPGEPCVPPTNRPYFRPNADVTRGQLSKIGAGAAGWTETPTTQTFADVPVGSTFYGFIERLANRGIVGGYPCGGAGEPCLPPENPPYFRPTNPATRSQLAKIAANSFFPTCPTPARR